MDQGTRIDKTLDIKGLAGVRLTEVTKDILRMMTSGQTLKVVTDSGGSRLTFPLLCETMNCRLLSVEEQGGIVSFVIRK